MSIYQLKGRFQDLLRPISNTLVKHGLTANQVTIAAVVLSGSVAHIIAKPAKDNPCLWAALPTGLFARMAMNAIDGMMAKEHGQASTLGAVLNEAGDIISDAVLLVSLFSHVADDTRHQLTCAMLLSTLSELVAIGATVATGERANHGPMGKSDRALALGLLGAAVSLGYRPNAAHQKLMLSAANILLLKTIYHRGKFILQK